MSPPAGPHVKFHRGVHLADFDLWLDPHDDRPFAFVSHAHSDHIGRHGEVILTPDTARLMQTRLPDARRKEHLLPFRQTAEVRPGLRATLFPAGHILGSAMFLGETDTGRLLYTGDFKLRVGLSAERAEPVRADTLVMETTFGLPRFRFPPTEQVLGDMVRFCRETIEENATPVLLGYSLGKGQEIIAALARAGLPAVLHGAVHRMTEVVRELRPDFPPAARYQPGTPFPAGHVLICPPSANGTRMITKLTNPRTAVLTGWALTGPGVLHRYGVDAAFPLSDHADYDDLLRLVALVQPRRVLTLHGYAAAFARDLRARGVEAWALTAENQMDLDLSSTGTVTAVLAAAADDDVQPSAETPPRVAEVTPGENTISDAGEIAPNAFARFVEVGERIASTTGKLKKTEYLAEYFRSLGDASLPIAAHFLAGRAFAQNDPRVLNVGGAVIRRALLAATSTTEARYRELSASLPDQGEITGVLFQEKAEGERRKAESREFGAMPSSTDSERSVLRLSPSAFSLSAAGQLCADLAVARGPTLKGEILRAALVPLPAAEARYVVKILTGELRIGLKEGLLEEALAVAFDRPADAIREANMLLGDLGRVALLARAGRLDDAELTLFQPIKTMLASPESTAEAIWARHEELRTAATILQRTEGAAAAVRDVSAATPAEVDAIVAADHHPPLTTHRSPPTASVVWVEDKFDGVRAQLHRGADGRVEIYSRDLRRVTGQFEEIARAASAMLPDTEVIFDGEIVAYQEGRKLTFFDLQKRLGRREADLFMQETVPLFFFVFDLLRLDGRPLLAEPLSERRARLERLTLRDPLRAVDVTRAGSAAETDAAFDAARRRGNEGLIVKDPASLYTPGRRGLAWLKLKKELATLDVVVVGAEWGHGKRNGVLSDYTFAVRDPARDEGDQLVTIGKAYSGLTDEEIAALTAQLLQGTLSTRGKYHVVRPEIVLEIAFDSIQPSARHTSGLALRFPRIKTIRRDKTPAEVDTLDYARRLAG